MRTRAVQQQANAIVAELERMGNQRVRDGMARYAICTDKALGIPMGSIQAFARSLGRSHELALVLWQTGWYEARMVAALIDEPELVTPSQMDRWCRDFDNWAICDTVCFRLFDRTPHAFGRIAQWSRRKDEFVKRASFALLASVALHDKQAPDQEFLRCLPLIERSATDERNFVKKGVSWALRVVGRRNPTLHTASVEVAQRLAQSDEAAARWVGRDALRDLTKPAVTARLKAKNRGRV